MKTTQTPTHDRLLAQLVLGAAIVMQVVSSDLLPSFMVTLHNSILVIEALLLVAITLSAPDHAQRQQKWPRRAVLGLLGFISAANVLAFVLISRLLIMGQATLSGAELITAAITIFATNIFVFALWYWEIDSPGLSGHRLSRHTKDFQFTQYDQPAEFVRWQPGLVDYIYLSVTNAINFAPADARPVTHQAKLLMGLQALVSVFTLALILARSVSLLH